MNELMGRPASVCEMVGGTLTRVLSQRTRVHFAQNLYCVFGRREMNGIKFLMKCLRFAHFT